MKITNTFTHIVARCASFVAVFALVGAIALPALAQWDYGWDYGGDYGYNNDWSYDWDYNWDYGGDYGYNNDYSYDWDYNWDYGGDYNWDYYDDGPGSGPNYDWNYSNDWNWDYGNYGYNNDYNYDYDYNYDWDYDWGTEPYEPQPCAGWCPPQCTLKASIGHISSGDSFELRWTTDGADFVTISSLGEVKENGTAILAPRESMKYELRATGPGGDVTCSTFVSVAVDHQLPPPEPASCDAFTASASRVQRGESVTLDWRTTNADVVAIDNGVGSVNQNGSTRVRIDRDTTFTLTAGNALFRVVDTCSVTVRVVDEPVENVSCDAFTASNSRVDRGDSVTLNWRTTNADSVRIDNGVGTVDEDGSERVRIDRDTTFTLTARNGSDTDTCTVTVRVDEEENDNVSCDAFTASNSRVDKGDSVTLTWRTTDADSVRIDNGVGTVDEDGSERVRIDRDTTFTLTARNGSDTDTCRVTVRIEDEENEEAPRCRLTISNTSITAGQEITLSWDNLRTDRAVIRDSFGATIADSRNRNGIDETRDSLKLRPTRSTDYTMTVYNGSETRTCTVGTEVTGGVTLTGTRGQDGILLSQVPYTGFEAGPVLTFIFYGVLGLWGAVVAYVLVMKKVALAAAASQLAAAPTLAPLAVAAVAPVVASAEVLEAAPVLTETITTDILRTLEDRAHAQYALISSDALTHIATEYGVDAEAVLDRAIESAKAQFPKEGDWIIINKDRLLSVLG